MARLYRAEEADVGTTARKGSSQTKKLAMHERQKGICPLCNKEMLSGEKLIDEHLRALGLGGSNDDSNRALVHATCAYAKTYGSDGDLAKIAKAKRQKMRHLGINQPKGRPLTGAGFQKAPPQRRASTPLSKSLPARRSLYGEA